MDDRSPQVVAVAVIFLILTWLTTGLRIYVRAGILRSFGMDDWLMALTVVLFTAYLICQLIGVAYGTGRHMWDLEPANAAKALRAWYFCELFYIMSSCLLKIAVGVFLLRITIHRIHRLLLIALNIGTAIFGLIYLFVVMFQCKPISNFWTWPNKTPQVKAMDGCINPWIIADITYAASAINSVADFTFGILPIFIVRKLDMKRKTKIIVGGILAFAAIGCISTLIRIPYISGLGHVDDFLWTTCGIAIWSTVEPGIGITAACIATLRPLFQNILFKTGISNHAYSSGPDSIPGWQNSPHSRQRSGYLRSRDIDVLRPSKHGTTTTRVSVGGSGVTSNSERKEDIHSQGSPSQSSEELMVPGKGISKSKEITIEYEEMDIGDELQMGTVRGGRS